MNNNRRFFFFNRENFLLNRDKFRLINLGTLFELIGIFFWKNRHKNLIPRSIYYYSLLFSIIPSPFKCQKAFFEFKITTQIGLSSSCRDYKAFNFKKSNWWSDQIRCISGPTLFSLEALFFYTIKWIGLDYSRLRYDHWFFP